MSWDAHYLYLAAEIHDDVLVDAHPNPTENYWNDDCLEVFLDPDGSGGMHLYSHNAFAYHIALDNKVVDLGTREGEVVIFNHHVHNRWQRSATPPYALIWEARIAFHTAQTLTPMDLSADLQFGFMLAYCDADGSGEREHFIGSQSITPIDNNKNIGYINADVFTPMQLINRPPVNFNKTK